MPEPLRHVAENALIAGLDFSTGAVKGLAFDLTGGVVAEVRLPTDLWTCPRVSWLIQRQFGVHYHAAHVSRVLHGLGFSPQRPTRRALERDEERIRAWIEQDWPRVKKTPRA